MLAAKFLGTLACFGLGALALSGQPAESQGQKTHRLLMKSMERVPGYNVIAVVMYRQPFGDEMEQVKIELRKDGRMHRAVLLPLAHQGVESVDDGKLMRTFIPDRNIVMSQPSALSFAVPTSQRMALIEHNYRMRVEDPTRIANREAWVVTAVPRWGELNSRRLYIDSVTGYLLKLEDIDLSGRAQVRVEAKSVSYPREIPDSVFELHLLGDTQSKSFPASVDLKDADPSTLPCPAYIPHRLPYGFVVSNAEVNHGKWKSIAVRITDGFVRGTVYQCRTVDAPDIKKNDLTRVAIGDISLTVVMDAPSKVREQILQAFSKASPSGSASAKKGTYSLVLDPGTFMIVMGVSDINSAVWPVLLVTTDDGCFPQRCGSRIQ